MSENDLPHHDESILVAVSPEQLYDLVSDVTRTGEWSPVCRACWWEDESEAGRVGAWFGGRNETPTRTWETRSQVVASPTAGVSSRGRSEARWSAGLQHDCWKGPATRLAESWSYLPDGIARFEELYGDDAQAQILDRTQQAHDGIPRTLAAIKEIAEAAAG